MPRRIIAILALGIILRAIWSVVAFVPPFKDPRTTMSKMYVRSAHLLATGHGYAQVASGSPAQRQLDAVISGAEALPPGERLAPEGLYPETLHPPGTSLAAAAFILLLKINGWHALQLAGGLADLLGIYLIWRLARALDPGSPLVATAAALIYAVFPPLLAATSSARDIAFMPPLTLLALCAYLKYFRTRRRRWFVLSAVATGVAAYFRPDALLFTAFLGFAHTREFLARPSAAHFLRCLARPIAAMILALLVLLPWAVRNKAAIDRWVFTSTGSGCTLVTGLGTYPNPWGFGRSDMDRDREAKDAGYRGAFDPAADAYFRAKFYDAVRSHPGAFAGILGKRLLMPLAPPYDWGLELKGDLSWGEIRAKGGSPFDNVGYLVQSYWPNMLSSALAGLGLIGMIWWAIRGSWQDDLVLVLVLPYVYVTVTHLFTHMAPYYLLPAVCCQILGLAYLVRAISGFITNKGA